MAYLCSFVLIRSNSKLKGVIDNSKLKGVIEK